MSSRTDVRRSLRRLKSDRFSTALFRRERALLPFAVNMDSVPKMLLDTTVYIDKLQGRMPANVDSLLDRANIWHSTVTECEMGVLAGLLNPAHPDTAHAVEEVVASIEARGDQRIVNPDRDTWREAGILAGSLARLQQYGRADQRRALNDALIFLSAAKEGLTVLTRNIADYDLLMQLAPQGQAVFYDL